MKKPVALAFGCCVNLTEPILVDSRNLIVRVYDEQIDAVDIVYDSGWINIRKGKRRR